MRKLLMETERGPRTLRSPITIIDPERLEEFYTALDLSDISNELKAFISVTLSGGGRVSEILDLSPSNIDFESREATIRVRKKKDKRISKKTGKVLKLRKVYRTFDLHPVAIKYLCIIKKGTKHFGKVFKFSPSHAWKKMREIFGGHFCVHSLRHSSISAMLHKEKESRDYVEKVMKLDFDTVSSYNHVKRKRRW